MKNLTKLLSEGEVLVTFKKKDGTMRNMRCTTNPKAFPDHEFKGSKRKPNSKVPAVWDLEANGFRSFRLESVVAINNKTVSGE